MKKGDTVRIGVVEDQVEFLRALVASLRAHPGWDVVARCSTVAEVLTALPGAAPDLILLDLWLGEFSAIELIPRLRGQLPGVPIIALTIEDRPAEIVRAIRAGASGYLLKGDLDHLWSGIEEALEGRAAIMSPGVARRLWEIARSAPPPEARAAGLTSREWEVLQLAARGKQQGEIAHALGIALNTVKNHFRSIYEKLGVGTLTEAFIRIKGGRGLLDD